MDVVTLNRRYNWLWSQTERLVEKFLKHHLDETPETAKKPVLPSPRDVLAITRSLKLIYDGRRAILLDREHPLDAHTEEEAANRAFEEVSRRIQALIEQEDDDGVDDNEDDTAPGDAPHPETPSLPTEDTPKPDT